MRGAFACCYARRERQRGRTAEQRDEVAAPDHSITSSARARSESEIRDGGRRFTGPNTRFDIATIHYISVPCSHQKPISISRYIIVAAVKFSRPCSGLPVQR